MEPTEADKNMTDDEIEEIVRAENEITTEERIADLESTIDRLMKENQELRETNTNIMNERQLLTDKVNEQSELIRTQAKQLQSKMNENDKNLVTIDALQEKLVNVIRSINN